MFVLFKGNKNLMAEDLEELSSNNESFCNMGSTLTVVLRLFSRAVISQRQRDKLVRKCQLEGQRSANSMFIKCVAISIKNADYFLVCQIFGSYPILFDKCHIISLNENMNKLQFNCTVKIAAAF